MQGCGWLPADDGGNGQLVCPHDHSTDRHEACKLSLACFCDPAAWVGAALFTGFSWLSVKKKLRASLPPEDTSSSSEAK